MSNKIFTAIFNFTHSLLFSVLLAIIAVIAGLTIKT